MLDAAPGDCRVRCRHRGNPGDFAESVPIVLLFRVTLTRMASVILLLPMDVWPKTTSKAEDFDTLRALKATDRYGTPDGLMPDANYEEPALLDRPTARTSGHSKSWDGIIEVVLVAQRSAETIAQSEYRRRADPESHLHQKQKILVVSLSRRGCRPVSLGTQDVMPVRICCVFPACSRPERLRSVVFQSCHRSR